MQGLEELIRQVRFTPVRLERGYDMGEVDALLDRVLTAAREGGDAAAVARSAQFSSTRWREGYSVSDVDGFLDQLQTWLRSHG